MHGKLESSFRAFYQACEASWPEDKDKHATRNSLKRLANAASQKCKQIFADQPEIAKLFVGMCGHVKAYEIRRNIALHGGYVAMFPKAGPVKLCVAGTYHEKVVLVEFDEGDIAQLWHDIASLDGYFLQLFEQTTFSLLTPEQTQIVRGRLLPHYRQPPTPPLHPRLPITSLW
jgi:hypothetical protein